MELSLIAGVGTFMLGSVFGAVTTIAVFRSSLAVMEEKQKAFDVRVARVERDVTRLIEAPALPYLSPR